MKRPAKRMQLGRETIGRLDNLIWCAFCGADHDRDDYSLS